MKTRSRPRSPQARARQRKRNDFRQSFSVGTTLYVVRAYSAREELDETVQPPVRRQFGIVVTVLSAEERVFSGFAPHSLFPKSLHQHQTDLNEMIYRGTKKREYLARLVEVDRDKMHLTFALEREFFDPDSFPPA